MAVGGVEDAGGPTDNLIGELKAGPSTPAQIAARMGHTVPRVRVWLTRLKARGLVRNPRRGVWALALERTMAKEKTRKKTPVRVPVRTGDAFNPGLPFVVLRIEGARATVAYADNGRRSRILVRRLQREYDRLGEVASARAGRRLERALRSRAHGRSR